jgi:hypothetical protein
MSRRLVSLTGHEMPLSKGRLCVGTDPAAEVPVTPGTGLQARHFIIDTTGEVARLHACEGGETWLNGQPVQEAELRSGDLISAGALEVRFVDDEAQIGARSLPENPVGSVPTLAPPKKAAFEGAVLMVGGLALCLVAMWAAYEGLMMPVRELRPEDVITREARLISIQPHPGWLQAHFDGLPGCAVEMPKGLFARLFHQLWPCREELCGNKGWPAVVGFERSVLQAAGDSRGEPRRMLIITLEVNGESQRTLSQHNAIQRDAAGIPWLAVLPLIMLGVFIGSAGHDKWKAAHSMRRYTARSV